MGEAEDKVKKLENKISDLEREIVDLKKELVKLENPEYGNCKRGCPPAFLNSEGILLPTVHIRATSLKG